MGLVVVCSREYFCWHVSSLHIHHISCNVSLHSQSLVSLSFPCSSHSLFILKLLVQRWCRSARFALIEGVRVRPEMWNVAKKKASDPKLWEMVAQFIKAESGEKYSALECKKQFRNLCDNFRRNKKKFYDVGKQPCWDYWHQMKYLLDRPTTSTPQRIRPNRHPRVEPSDDIHLPSSSLMKLVDPLESYGNLAQLLTESLTVAASYAIQPKSHPCVSPPSGDGSLLELPLVTVSVSHGNEIVLPECINKDEGLVSTNSECSVSEPLEGIHSQRDEAAASTSPIGSLCSKLTSALESLHSYRPEVSALYEYEISYLISRIHKSIEMITQHQHTNNVVKPES